MILKTKPCNQTILNQTHCNQAYCHNPSSRTHCNQKHCNHIKCDQLHCSKTHYIQIRHSVTRHCNPDMVVSRGDKRMDGCQSGSQLSYLDTPTAAPQLYLVSLSHQLLLIKASLCFKPYWILNTSKTANEQEKN